MSELLNYPFINQLGIKAYLSLMRIIKHCVVRVNCIAYTKSKLPGRHCGF
jgi:hypothetical protein